MAVYDVLIGGVTVIIAVILIAAILCGCYIKNTDNSNQTKRKHP